MPVHLCPSGKLQQESANEASSGAIGAAEMIVAAEMTIARVVERNDMTACEEKRALLSAPFLALSSPHALSISLTPLHLLMLKGTAGFPTPVFYVVSDGDCI